MKFRKYVQNQILLLPPDIIEMIPPNHVVRGIDAIVEQLNLERLYNSYSEEGQPGYHPKMLLKILLYGYSTGIMSSRKIAGRVESDIYYMYLSGMQRPDFRTISDFRKNKREYLSEYFQQILAICKAMGLISLGHIAIDGSKIEANASRKRMLEKDSIDEEEGKIQKRIADLIQKAEEIDANEDKQYGENKRGDELPEELAGERKLLEKIKEAKKHLEEKDLKRVNVTDPATRLMHEANGGLEVCYNAQISVDSDYQIIAATDVVSDEADHGQFIPMYEKTILNLKKKPKEVSADAGYQSGLAYLYLETQGIDGYMPDCRFNKETDGGQEEKLDKYDRRNFKYNKNEDTYTCPEGKELTFKSHSNRNGVHSRVYKCSHCPGCSQRSQCLLNPESRGCRQIQVYENDTYKSAMRKKLLSEGGREKYNKRMWTVEPVFAQIKRGLGFRQFLLRGIDKVKFEFSLVCMAHNIKKLIKYAPLLAV